MTDAVLFHQGYYDTMDAGFVDEDGFLYIMSRSDDVINVAGHRLSAGAVEEVGGRRRWMCVSLWRPHVCVSQSVLQHPAVGDCAVVGLEDALKGHVPLALCVLKHGEASHTSGWGEGGCIPVSQQVLCLCPVSCLRRAAERTPDNE